MDSSFLDLKLFLNGVKFNAIPESREMNKKMDELLRKHDYLMFFQNFDLFEKSCDGGIIFRADKNIFVGVIITGRWQHLPYL